MPKLKELHQNREINTGPQTQKNSSSDLVVILIRIARLGDEGTFIEDLGWSDCVFEFYEQIIATKR